MRKNLTDYIQPLITFTFCFMLFCQSSAMAQTQDEGNRKGVLRIQMMDTRSLSMAGTTIADNYGRPSIGLNAALTGMFNEPPFIQFNSNHNWDNNFMQHDLTLPTIYYGAHHVTARFGLLHRGFQNLPFTNTALLPEPDIIMYRAELAYAFAISNHFSIGTLQSMSYTTTTEEAQYLNYFADIGLVYAPDSPVSYGLVFRGLGRETAYEIIETGETILDSQLARQRLEIGATFQYPIEERTYLSISFTNEKRFGQDGLWYKGGFEVIPVSVIHIRGGAMVNFDQSLFIPRMGLGFNASVFQIDYMMAPKNLIGEHFHQIGLTVQF